MSSDQIQYCPCSKGYSQQDVSSFTLGPVVGSGLCIVNAAFSKMICITHLQGGKVDLKRKNFWKPAKKPTYQIEYVNEKTLLVDGEKVKTRRWLKEHRDEWKPEWTKWSQSVALCSRGDFHWSGDSPRVAFLYQKKYLGYVDWKKQCYIQPAYDLLEETEVMKFMRKIWEEHHVALGLVHPMGNKGEAETPVTREFIRELYDSETTMACMPYVVVGKLLGVEIYASVKDE